MAGASIVTEATLLGRQESGDKGLLLTFLSPTHGLLRAFRRISATRIGRQPLPDLFDEVSLTLEPAKDGGLLFVREYRVRARRSGIGENYQTLVYASRFARILTRHIFVVEEAVEWHLLLQQSLYSWENQLRPEATYFKSLYLFARNQGIPVREEWVPTLRSDHITQVTTILREPLASQTTPKPIVENLISAIEGYLHHQHDIHL